MESITNTLGNIKNSVANAANAFMTPTPAPPITRSDINQMEEDERSRRIEQASQSQVDKENAANVSSLIKTQSFPVFKGNTSKGYKRVTTKFEDEERRRRLTNKSESSLRRNNANHTARMISGLGWPFYQQNHSGAEFIVMDPSKLLEEEERAWRTTDAYWAPTAKHNAAMVANILRWGNFQMNPKSGIKRHTRFLENKERKDRSRDEIIKPSVDNAWNEAGLIREKGDPFYVQDNGLPKRDFTQATKLANEERKRNIKIAGRLQMAEEFPGQHNDLEEAERVRRIEDDEAQKLAKDNAKQVSLMVRENSSNKLQGIAPMWFNISRNSMRALEDIERTRRMRDEDGQREAKSHAKMVSDMVSHKWSLPPKRNLNTIEEEERQNRILDRTQSNRAVKNARKVSGMIARHNLLSGSSFSLAQEESERARRLADSDQQTLARNNAKKVSGLVSSLNVAPGHHVSTKSAKYAPERSAPLSPAQLSTVAPTESLPTFKPATDGLPTYQVPQSPITVNIPVTPSTPVYTAPSTPVYTAPSTPVYSAPSTPIYNAPSTPVYTAPSTPINNAPSTPIYTAPSTPIYTAPSTPIYTAPSTLIYTAPSTPIYTAPATPIYSAPVAPLSSQPRSISPVQDFVSTTSIPVPVTPLASAIAPLRSSLNSMPVTGAPVATVLTSAYPATTPFSTPMAPVEVIAMAHPQLGERQRAKLLKQAERHNRKSDKDVRKAEARLAKAEKMHLKGRDDKAVKLEHKSDMFMQKAEHERNWANGIQSELAPNAPAPASM